MATLETKQEATSRLEAARSKFKALEKIANLRRQNFIEEEDVPRIPSIIPRNSEELTAFMQQLFQYGVKKWMPGCPVRLNRNVVSVRLDGVQFRKANEVRQLFEKNGIRTYLNDKNRELYNLLEQNVQATMRGNGSIEFVQEEGRDFYHIPATSASVTSSGISNIYQSIVMQGRYDQVLNQNYDTVMALVKERNDERRREFIINRTQLNAEYIEHVVNTLTIPFEHLNNPEMVAALQEAGMVAFIKQPTLQELVSTDAMVDVFSAPSEEDETWRIMPVIPDIIESSEERIYHGQGVITAYDPTSAASKNGALPYVIQHCLRAGADIADFLMVLPEDFRNKLATCNDIYLQFTGDSSESIDKAVLARTYEESQHQAAQQAAQEAILSAESVSSLAQEGTARKPRVARRKATPAQPQAQTQEELDRLIREAFAKPVPEQEAVQAAQSAVVDTLTEQLLAQMQGQSAEPATGDDELPFDVEPAVVQEAVPSADELYEQMLQQLAQPQQAPSQPAEPVPAEPGMSYHSYYGQNPIFVQLNGAGNIHEYIAFSGHEGRAFDNFNAAAIYAGKQAGETVLMYKYTNRYREAVGDDTVYPRLFDGRLF